MLLGQREGVPSSVWGRRTSGGIREDFLEEGMASAWVFKNELDFTVCKRRHLWLVQMPME